MKKVVEKHFTRLRKKPQLPVLRSRLLRRVDKTLEDAQRVSSEALAKEDTLRRVPPKTQKGARL